MTRYRYRTDELLVHVDDCGLVRTDLAAHGYHSADSHGSLRRFVGASVGRSVPDVLAELRLRHGATLRVGPNHVFGRDRIIRGLEAKPTRSSLPVAATPAKADALEVGVIDTGIVRRGGLPHPFLSGRVRFDDADEDTVSVDAYGRPAGSDGHGTFVSGVVLVSAPMVRVRMKGVLDRSVGDVEDRAVARAIDELREEGITLINLSFSGDTWENKPPQAIEDALRRLDQDVVVVAAAGNRSRQDKVFPAAIDLGDGHARMIAVGAVDPAPRSAPLDPFDPAPRPPRPEGPLRPGPPLDDPNQFWE